MNRRKFIKSLLVMAATYELQPWLGQSSVPEAHEAIEDELWPEIMERVLKDYYLPGLMKELQAQSTLYSRLRRAI